MKKYLSLISLASLIFLSPILSAQVQSESIRIDEDGSLSLTVKGASHFAQLALKCIDKQYPNKTGQVIVGPEDVKPPAELHPAFFGCFDWHSSVHGHWMLVKLLKWFPDIPEATRIRQALMLDLSKEKLLSEAGYFLRPGAKTFERTYGWAWLLKLAEELHDWDDPDGMIWKENVKPLENVIVNRFFDFLPRQTYPNRTGEHPNTAFGMIFAWDYARTIHNDSLLNLLKTRALNYYYNDRSCPASWEPGSSDFLSPCLEEADLMRRILPLKTYRKWLKKFLPGLWHQRPVQLFTPADVSDRSDPKIVHLDGLNLSRAWCFYGIAKTINTGKTNPDDPLTQAANAHILTTLPYIASGEYGGEHWLASFAVYALSMEQ